MIIDKKDSAIFLVISEASRLKKKLRQIWCKFCNISGLHETLVGRCVAELGLVLSTSYNIYNTIEQGCQPFVIDKMLYQVVNHLQQIQYYRPGLSTTCNGYKTIDQDYQPLAMDITVKTRVINHLQQIQYYMQTSIRQLFILCFSTAKVKSAPC